ncbi:MAG: Gx transporter family protein [Clostridia bacterium]|nr:Gx transporter family protein [Clostridia bacterium]
MKVRTLTKMALLSAAAMILGYIDSLIPLVPGVPGIKLGLSNLALLYAVFFLSPFYTVLLMLIKVGMSSLLFGNAVGALYSLAGGVLSVAIMLLLRRNRAISVIPVSTFGGIFHILGQIAVGTVLLGVRPMLAYAPWLLISGLATGILLGVCACGVFYGLERYERSKRA